MTYNLENADVKVYRGEYIVAASPLSRGEYVKLRGWAMPYDENPADEGYILQGNGTTTWKAKDEFENNFFEVEPDVQAATVPAYQQRVKDEYFELDKRLTALRGFIESSAFSYVAQDERVRLMNQSFYMKGYLAMLTSRILHFK